MRSKTMKGYKSPFGIALSNLMAKAEDKPKTKQADLIPVLGVKNRQSVGDFVNGKTEPNMEQIIAVAKYFNVSADYLLGLKESRNPFESVKLLNKYSEFFDFLLSAEEELNISLIEDLLFYIGFNQTKMKLSFGSLGETIMEEYGKEHSFNSPLEVEQDLDRFLCYVLFEKLKRSLDTLRESAKAKSLEIGF